ncbi:probable U3 small nucleolar RNA-associated protein 11 [Saccostrea echinata]|uniref:probable U3 small nucleolar RNA-associated protein 11 n=1 Tax=Saccostrea echinata TaxID=191078 RepID=UPI002A813A14|nr:probable U3 small nucleolar RNA-associated protein 11 [Saccostrea echinata]
MASLRKASKSSARTYKERSQPSSRAHLGFLEKKKDYKERAEDFQRKQNTLKVLKRKALNRNPDEFYFNMVKTQKVDGIHQEKEETEPIHTEAELKLMFSQDQRYVTMKRTSELNKIERLQSNLHLMDNDTAPKNKHTVFVDTDKEVKEFDAAKYFGTHPSLVNRRYNRPTLDSLKKMEIRGNLNEEDLKAVSKQKQQRYQELVKRIEREKELHVIQQKMEMKKHLMDKKEKRTKLQEETKTSAPVYRWRHKRKR